MLLNTVLSAPNAELEVDFVILLDLEPLRVSAGDAKKAGSVCPQGIPSLPHILFLILILNRMCFSRRNVEAKSVFR
jgi:hypothetical protein